MKNSVLLTITLLTFLGFASVAQAAPKSKDKETRRAQIAELAKDKETRLMMIHQLMSTSEGKKELVQTLKGDAEFRSYYDTSAVNPG